MAHRNYVWTLYQEGLRGDDVIERVGGCDGVRDVVAQLERCPTSGRLHLQGYIELSRPMRMPQALRLFEPAAPHLEPRRGTREQAREYCRKQDTRVDGPWEHGEWGHGGAGQRTDLSALKASIDSGSTDAELWEEHFGHMLRNHRGIDRYRLVRGAHVPARTSVAVHVFYGPTGTGKSHRAFAEAGPDAYALAYTSGTTWFDGYSGSDSLVLDEFYGGIPHSFLLRILDKYPLQVPIKGGFVQAAWTQVFITSNQHPKDWYDKAKIPDTGPLFRRLTDVTRMDTPYAPPVPI